MQIRLAIERTDYRALRIALHNAAELDEWSERLDEAFTIGRRVWSELLRKDDERLMGVNHEEHGWQLMTPEEIMGPRVPIPEVCLCCVFVGVSCSCIVRVNEGSFFG